MIFCFKLLLWEYSCSLGIPIFDLLANTDNTIQYPDGTKLHGTRGMSLVTVPAEKDSK